MNFRQTGYLALTALMLAGFANRSPAADAPPGRVFPVTEFGAVGDGTTLDTAAIQRAVDACSAAGGGTVLFPPGAFLSGTVFLKDNVCLYLDAKAVLRGSPRPEDYPAIPQERVGRAGLQDRLPSLCRGSTRRRH